MAIAVTPASILRAVEKIIVSGDLVTIPKIAQGMHADSSHVRRLITGIASLAADIRETGRYRSPLENLKRIRAAAASLRERRVAATVKTLAFEAGVAVRGLEMWLRRHPTERETLGVIAVPRAAMQYRIQAYTASAAYLKENRLKFTVKAIAEHAGFDEHLIYKDMRRVPKLRGTLIS